MSLRKIIPYAYSHALIHSFELILPPLIPIIVVYYNISYFEVGILATFGYFLFGIGQIPFGVLYDKLRGNFLVILSLAGAAFFSILVGLSTSFLTFVVFFAAMNLFLSIFHPPAFALISHRFKGLRGRAMGILGLGGTFGLALTPTVVAWLGETYRWQIPYILFGILGILAAVIHWTERKEYDQHVEREKLEKKRRITSYFILLISVYVIKGFIYRGALTFLPTYISSFSSVYFGGLIVTFMLVSGGFGQILGGEMVDRFNRVGFLVVLLSLDTIFLLLLFFSSTTLIYTLPVALGFTYFAGQTVINVLISDFTPESSRGAGYGIAFSIAFTFGSFSSTVAGYIADILGFEYIFLFLGAISVLSVIITMYLWRLWHETV